MIKEKMRRGRRGRRLPRLLLLFLLLLLTLSQTQVAAQDPVDQGVRLGITYTPGMRPGMLVLGGPHRELLDSVRTIIQSD